MSWVGGYESFENEKDWPAEARLTVAEAMEECCESEYGCGFHSRNRIKKLTDRIFVGKENAEAYVSAHDSEWCRKYNPYVEYIEKSAKLKALESRVQKAEESRNKMDLLSKTHIVIRKSKTISCKKCGSSLNLYLLVKHHLNDYHRCPVCGGDLRSKSVLDRIDRLDSKVNELKKQKKEEEERLLAQKIKKTKILFAYEEYIG